MSITSLLAQAIYNKLSGGTALTALLSGTVAIYHMQAPDKAVLPYVVFNLQGGGPENITPSDMRNVVYNVRGYASSALAAANIDRQVSSLLHGGSVTVTGYTNYYLVREIDLALVENPPDKKPVFMVGALYRIRIDS